MEDGLPSNFVYRAQQDSKGFIWFCTDKGLVKFDGVSFKNFDLDDRLPHNDIFDIHIDKDEKIWLSTFNATCYIKNDSIYFLDLPNKKEAGLITHRFIGEKYHLIQLRGASNRHFFVKQDSIIEIDYPRNKLFRGYLPRDITLSDIYKNLNVRKFTKTSTLIYPLFSSIFFQNSLINFQDKSLIIHSDSISILKRDSYKLEAMSDIWGENPNITNVRHNENVIVINGEKESFVINEHLEQIDSLKFLANKSFNSFIIDNESNLWLCGNTGITYINQNPFASKQFKLQDPEDIFACIIVDDKDELIIATKNGRILQLENKQTLTELNRLNLEDISTIKLGPKNNILYLQDYKYGLFYLELNKESNQQLNLKNINSLYESSIKDFSIGEANEIVIAHSKGASIYRQNKATKIFDERSYSIITGKDKIYIGTTEGLYESNRDTFSQIDGKHFNHYIHKLYQDDLKNLYILSNKGGLWHKKGEAIKIIEGTEHLFINDIISDDHNNLWLATTTGLYQLNLNPSSPKAITKLGNSHGIIDQNIIDVVLTKDRLFAISEKTLYSLPVSKNPIKKNSQFYFNELVVNNTQRDSEYLKDLTYKENNIEVNFTTISYTDLGEFNYRWKLLPSSSEWQETQDNSLLFNSLSSGEYELLISVYDSEGNILHKNKKLYFTINKPWYATKLFIFFALCAAAFLYYLIDKQRQSIQKKRAEEKNEIQRQFYELRLKAVQAQMNPHFIFNALNSIQKFIYQKSPEEANQYIVKFSKLMRMILDSTNKNYSTLQEEIELLDHYVSLEQLRFEHSFDYSLELSEDINMHELLIPSTLLQPFVENSINHGLSSKKGQGHLWLRFKIKENHLIAEVEDNGIGRKRARQLKKGTHESRALNIINERKKILLLRDNYELNYQYEDKVDENKLNTGTKLTLSVPLIYD